MTVKRAPQKRRTETHDRLVAAAEEICAAQGFAAMRVEEVVLRAGVAKGTFFSHFGDKDALMAALIGKRLAAAMAQMQAAPTPQTPREIASAMVPLIDAMSSERVVFDVVLRYSGAAAITEVGPIAQNFFDQMMLFMAWIEPLQGASVRADASAELLAEGLQAFLVQSIAMSFCAIEGQQEQSARLEEYLDTWLRPRT